jgi:hypothetical protein
MAVKTRHPVGMGLETAVSTPRTSVRSGQVLIWFGIVVLAAAVTLYVSGASRAVAVWLTPLGVGAVLLGFVTLRRQKVPRWALAVLATAVVVLVAVGLATWVYSASTAPSTITPVTQRPSP